MDHYPSLFVAYGGALAAWVLLWRLFPGLWPKQEPYPFERPWREVGYALLAGLAVVAIGQLYLRGIRLPERGAAEPVLNGLNQLLIFAPVPLLLVIRKQPPETAWLRFDGFGWRIGAGLGLALWAILIYTLAREGAGPWWQVVPRVYAYANIGMAVQVFLEDLTIAVLVVRLRSAMGTAGTIVLVAALFAAGHIPTMVSEGASLGEMASLIGDTALGVGVIAVAIRAQDIWWLWCVHFAMDMMQFERISGVAG